MKNKIKQFKCYLKGFENLSNQEFEYNHDNKVIKLLYRLEKYINKINIQNYKKISEIKDEDKHLKKLKRNIKSQNNTYKLFKYMRNLYMQLIQIKYI